MQQLGDEIQNSINRGQIIPTTDSQTYQTKENDNFIGVKAVKIPADQLHEEKRRIWKSLACLCITVTLSFSATMALVNSITSLYTDGNLGISVLAVAGASQVVSSSFASVTLKLWGSRNMLRVGLMTNMVFLIAFFYPNWFTLVIAAIFEGFTVSVLFSAGFMYANSAGYWLAHLTNSNNLDAVLTLVSGIMNASLGGGFIWGNLVLYLILGPPPEVEVNTSKALCGAAYCNEELNLTTLEPPSPYHYYTLIGALTAMGAIACVISYFLEDFSVKLGQERGGRKDICTVLFNSWRVFKSTKGLLLAPLTVVIAMEEAFLVGDVTKALVSCSLGISMVGLVMMAFGITEVVVSLGHWPIVQKFGRPYAVGTAVLIFMVAIITMLLWKPNPHQVFVYFLLVCLWGLSDAILLSVTFATFGAFFEDNLEGAFATASFWLSTGLLFSFGWSPFICVHIKLYCIAAMFCISFALYLIAEKCALVLGGNR